MTLMKTSVLPRVVLFTAIAITLLATPRVCQAAELPLNINLDANSAKAAKVPVIDVTDLYHPCQDIGDNFDLLTAYALPEIDLRAIILDCTDEWRSKGRLDPGFIPVTQLNYLFNRNVPCATIPWRRMKTLDSRTFIMFGKPVCGFKFRAAVWCNMPTAPTASFPPAKSSRPTGCYPTT